MLSGQRPVLTREDFAFLAERMGDCLPEISVASPATGLFTTPQAAPSSLELPPDGLDLNQVVSEMEKKLMLQSLQITRGNKKRAAELLGLKRTTFLEKMKRLDLEDVELSATEED